MKIKEPKQVVTFRTQFLDPKVRAIVPCTGTVVESAIKA